MKNPPMWDAKTIVNALGLAITIAGIWITYRYSPINEWEIDGGDASTDFDKIERETKRKNRMMSRGIYTVLVGTGLQLVSTLLPTSS